MLDWFRRLVAGHPGPPPDGVIVERDASGRITRASATLSAAREPNTAAAHPPLAVTPAIAPALAAASRWLCERNIVAAQRWGIGLEERYDVDQAEGRLVLSFEQALDLILEAQVLGSFDPTDCSFMWSWHNASVRPALQQAALRARADGERIGEPAFTTPVQAVVFDELTPVLARAAHVAEADGVVGPHQTMLEHAAEAPQPLPHPRWSAASFTIPRGAHPIGCLSARPRLGRG